MKPSNKSVKIRRRKKSKRSVTGRFYFVVIIATFAIAGVSLFFSAGEMRALKEERISLEQQIEAERQEQITLNSQKHYFESDSYIEKIAREQLGYVKPNDVIFIDRNSKK